MNTISIISFIIATLSVGIFTYFIVSKMKKDFVNLKGNKLEIRWIGELVKKSEPVIVFLHEGLGCVDLWRDFPATLYKTLKIPSLLYSRQGYGRSSPSKVPKSLDFMHKEALEILPKLLDLSLIHI